MGQICFLREKRKVSLSYPSIGLYPVNLWSGVITTLVSVVLCDTSSLTGERGRIAERKNRMGASEREKVG